MKKLLLLFLLALTINSASAKDKYDVYLLIGQSNMAGRAQMLAQDKEQKLENVWLLNEKGEIEPALMPLNKYSSIRKDIKMQGYNPGVGFSQKIAKETKRKVLLVVNAMGGTKVEQWQKGGQFFTDAVARTKQAQQYGELKAVLWHQGESNNTSMDTYMGLLSTMVKDLREELNNEKLPFIAGEIGKWMTYSEDVNKVIRTIDKHIPYSTHISSEGAAQRGSATDPHFGRDGQMVLGERYADKVLEIVYKKKK